MPSPIAVPPIVLSSMRLDGLVIERKKFRITKDDVCGGRIHKAIMPKEIKIANADKVRLENGWRSVHESISALWRFGNLRIVGLEFGRFAHAFLIKLL